MAVPASITEKLKKNVSWALSQNAFFFFFLCNRKPKKRQNAEEILSAQKSRERIFSPAFFRCDADSAYDEEKAWTAQES